MIAAIETGRRAPSDAVRRSLEDALRPSDPMAYTVGLGLWAYLDDGPPGRVLRNNGRHIVVRVATVAQKLPADYKDQHPDVDWIAIGRMRTLIAHHDDRVDDQWVFTALEHRVPDLLASLGVVSGDDGQSALPE